MRDSDRYGLALRRGQRCPDKISGGRRSSNATAPPTSPRSRSRRGGRGWDRSDPAPGLTRGSSSTPHGPTWRGIGEYGAGGDGAPSSFGRDRAFSAMRPLLLARPGGASGQRRYGGHARSSSRGSCSESTPACRERAAGVPFNDAHLAGRASPSRRAPRRGEAACLEAPGADMEHVEIGSGLQRLAPHVGADAPHPEQIRVRRWKRDVLPLDTMSSWCRLRPELSVLHPRAADLRHEISRRAGAIPFMLRPSDLVPSVMRRPR
jgi:hypothetical protein